MGLLLWRNGRCGGVGIFIGGRPEVPQERHLQGRERGRWDVGGVGRDPVGGEVLNRSGDSISPYQGYAPCRKSSLEGCLGCYVALLEVWCPISPHDDLGRYECCFEGHFKAAAFLRSMWA